MELWLKNGNDQIDLIDYFFTCNEYSINKWIKEQWMSVCVCVCVCVSSLLLMLEFSTSVLLSSWRSEWLGPSHMVWFPLTVTSELMSAHTGGAAKCTSGKFRWIWQKSKINWIIIHNMIYMIYWDTTTVTMIKLTHLINNNSHYDQTDTFNKQQQ